MLEKKVCESMIDWEAFKRGEFAIEKQIRVLKQDLIKLRK